MTHQHHLMLSTLVGWLAVGLRDMDPTVQQRRLEALVREGKCDCMLAANALAAIHHLSRQEEVWLTEHFSKLSCVN